MRVAVVSSCYGDYDSPWEPPGAAQPGLEVEWHMVTDGDPWPGWINHVEPRPHVHPNLAAKYAKARPGAYTGAELTVWVDAGARIGVGFWTWLDGMAQPGEHWIMYRHPQRTRLADEVIVSRTLPKYGPLPMEDQIEWYLRAGYPDENLWATGLIVRWNTPEADRVGTLWLAEMLRWGFQDQLSFAYVAWSERLEVRAVPGSLFSGDYVSFTDHTGKEWSCGESLSPSGTGRLRGPRGG